MEYPRFRTVASLAVALLLPLSFLTACTGSDEKATSGSIALPAPEPDLSGAPEELKEFYGQKVKWKECEGSYQCATVKVPLDYSQPEGKQIFLSLMKRPATKKALGDLFVNPGGPGGSGLDLVRNAGNQFTIPLRDSFNIIGFDPRGVGKSTPVDCVNDERLAEMVDANYDTSTPEGQAQADADFASFVRSCQEFAGDLLPFVGTENVVRDLDVIRGATGNTKLNYVGFSYGTYIGAQYIQACPAKAGRIILDGAVDGELSMAQASYDQGVGFEKAFTSFLEWCTANEKCEFASDVSAAAEAVRQTLRNAVTKAVATDDADRKAGQSTLLTGIIAPLYDQRAWPMLAMALNSLINDGDATTLQAFADLNNGREGDSFTSNIVEANWAINCADTPAGSDADSAMWAEKLKADAPILGEFFASDSASCEQWPYHAPAALGPFTGEGLDHEVVIVGTTGDPATPYAWAEKMHEQMAHSVLVTYEGEGHTAYASGGKCITDPLDAYLMKGTVPQDGLRCPANTK